MIICKLKYSQDRVTSETSNRDSYRIEFLSTRMTEPKEQSLPPLLFLHEQAAVQSTSSIEQEERLFPDGSVSKQVPLPEHTEPT